jgi:carboxymethylenebutenolidase
MKYAVTISIAIALLSLTAIAEPRNNQGATKQNISPVFYAGPDKAPIALVVIHDWFGRSPFYDEAIQKLAAQGYRVAAVDLYKGQNARNHEEAGKLMSQLNAGETERIIDTAVASLSGSSQQLAIIGFSMGAKFALQAATRHRQIKATVLWYGETVNAANTLKKLSGPVLYVVGSKDGAAAENAASFSKAGDEAGVPVEIFVYPGAAHAFAQPLFNEGKTYDADASALAWRITEDFLRRRLK